MSEIAWWPLLLTLLAVAIGATLKAVEALHGKKLADDECARLREQLNALDVPERQGALEVEVLGGVEQKPAQALLDSHGEPLDPVKERILLLLAAHDGIHDAQVASALGAGVQLATFHLNELDALKMVRCTLRVGQRETPWHISQEGRRYLVRHDMLT